ncbi:MAG TPA: carbamoyltransferase HypF [Clostridiaceae bacterium]
MEFIRVFIKVKGIVQGVGFRPFVYNLAIENNLNGYVNNSSEGVLIDIEGNNESIEAFLNTLKVSPPPLSKIDSIEVVKLIFNNYSSFTIEKSLAQLDKITLISPDIALCKDCRKDILNKDNRRYKYPFTNCTNCGPRFSIIHNIPYDRKYTTMKNFKMCPECEKEYTSPDNRRFHAQPNACSICGPKIYVEDFKGSSLSEVDPLDFTREKLLEGYIFAIKGLTGFHLVCDGRNFASIESLRERKKRSDKPFAIMVKDLETAKSLCHISKMEEEILLSKERPILLLNIKDTCPLPSNIAPYQKTLGIMLPYTPFQELLFKDNLDVLIMTSANLSGLPLEYTNEKAKENLKDIVDYFLFHNRDIYIPLDDSVGKVLDDKFMLIRRARGYVPAPIKYTINNNILAAGSNMKNTFSIAKEDFIFVSQHTGDLQNIETLNHYKWNIDHFKKVFLFNPEIIAYDMHPNYLSSEFALEGYEGVKRFPVQHHHAHIVSSMVENNIDEPVLGIAYDGTGYGDDGKLWGGEILYSTLKDYKRLAHLEYIKMPGGEKAILEPWRMAVSYIYKYVSNSNNVLEALYDSNYKVIIKMLQANINSPETSSIGRLFDAVSSIIGIRNNISYEGQASIELESTIQKINDDTYGYELIESNPCQIINPEKLINELVQDKLNNKSKSYMACKFHNTVVNFTVELIEIFSKATGINKICLGGGVFQNSYLLLKLKKELEHHEFDVYTNSLIPINDGGISLGQLVIAEKSLLKVK